MSKKKVPVECVSKPEGIIWPAALLTLLGAVIVLRLVIWKFLPGTEILFKENFSNVAVAAVIFVLAFVWGTRKVFRQESWPQTGFELPLVLLLSAAAFSLLYTADFHSSILSLIVLAAQIVFFYMIVDGLRVPALRGWFLLFLLGTVVVVAGYGVKEFFYLWNRPLTAADEAIGKVNDSLYYILANRRVVSFIGWPNSLAGYLMLLLPVFLAAPFLVKAVWQKGVAVLAALCVLACFLFTFSFLGWVSFLLGAIAVVVLFWEQIGIKAWPRERQIALALAAAVFLGLFLWVILRKNFLASLMPRIFYYKEGLGLLGDKPFLGHGWGTFGVVSRRFAETPSSLTTYLHNSYLQVWVEAGILGFAAMCLLVVTFFRRARTAVLARRDLSDRLLVLAVVWGMTAFLIDNLFSFTILKPNIALHGWVMLAVFATFSQGKELTQTGPALRRIVPFVAAAAALLILCVPLVRVMTGFSLYYQARYTKKAQVLQHTTQALAQAGAWDPWGAYIPAAAGEVRVRAFMMTREGGYLKEAELDYLEAVQRAPFVYSNYFILGRIYALLGQKGQAVSFMSRAHALSPFEYDRDTATLQKQASQASGKTDVPVPRPAEN